MWGPEVGSSSMRSPIRAASHRGSQRDYLPATQVEPVLAYLRGLGCHPVGGVTCR